MKEIKIVIADDHPLITEGLKNMLNEQSNIKIVNIFHDGESLLESVKGLNADVLLLDINMPGMQGDDVAREVLKHFPAMSIIVLTNLDNIYYINNMLQIGVRGYILKNIGSEALIQAIETVYSGGKYLDVVVQERMSEINTQLKKQQNLGNMLTRREKEVLQLIAENNTSKEIAEKLHLSKRTIDHHRESILAKMDVKNVSALVKKAIELGMLQV